MMSGGAPYKSWKRWSWKRFFVSFSIIASIMSMALWWHSGRFPFSPQEVRFRILMIRSVNTIAELDRKNGFSSISKFSVNRRITHLCESFEKFLNRYPSDDQAMNAYGTFLEETGNSDAAIRWWEKAAELSPKNPKLLNNLANYYGHNGEAEKAIRLYEEAIRINPSEPVYHFNLANMYYLFRKETHAIHGWNLDKTFRHSLVHFRIARNLAPENIDYAISYAETFYGVKFLSKNFDWNDAESAWKYCLSLNNKPGYQDMIRVHIVRVNAYEGESLEALEWYNKLESSTARRLSWQILKRFFPEETGNEA